MNEIEEKFYYYEKSAEVEIDNLVDEVFYNGRIYKKKEEVLKVSDILAQLRHYIEDKEWELELNLNFIDDSKVQSLFKGGSNNENIR